MILSMVSNVYVTVSKKIAPYEFIKCNNIYYHVICKQVGSLPRYQISGFLYKMPTRKCPTKNYFFPKVSNPYSHISTILNIIEDISLTFMKF